jgi:hypothetical protein
VRPARGPAASLRRLVEQQKALQSATKIRDCQQALGGLGYYDGPIDGLLTDRLAVSVSRYQRQVHPKALRKGSMVEGLLTDAVHSCLIEDYAHGANHYNDPPTFYPPTDEEMVEARDDLLRTERLLEEG